MVRLLVLGSYLDSPLEAGQGLRLLAAPVVQGAEVDVRVRVIRIKFDCLPQVGLGLLRPPQREESDTPAVEGLDIIRVDMQGALAHVQGLLPAPLPEVQVAEVV